MSASLFNAIMQLPLELQIAIFAHVDTYTIVDLVEKPGLKHLTFTKSLIYSLNFAHSYRFNMDLLVFMRGRKDMITELNINCIYWIPRRQLLNAIKRLRYLQSLHILDTEVRSGCALDMAKRITKLRKFAFSFNTETRKEPFSVLKNLTHLTVHFDEKPNSLWQPKGLITLIRSSTKLCQLWLVGLKSFLSPQFVRHLSSNVERLMVVVAVSQSMEEFRTCARPTIVYDSSRGLLCRLHARAGTTDVYERFDAAIRDESWQLVLKRLHPAIPFDCHTCTLLCRNTPFSSIKLTELNFMHSACDTTLQTTIGQILVSDRLRSLRKLAITYCLFGAAVTAKPKERPLFKQRRVGASTSTQGDDLFNRIVSNCGLLTDLEIWGCDYTGNIVCSTIKPVVHLKNLKRLALFDLPKKFNSQCLVEICSTLSLQSLTMSSNTAGCNLGNFLLVALRRCKSLNDLRLENVCHIEHIIDNCTKHSIPLTRIAIKTDKEQLNSAIMLPFLTKYVDLKCFCLSGNLTQTFLLKLYQLCREMRPEMTVWVGSLKYTIPECCYYDMIVRTSKVAQVDVYRDYF